MKKNEFIDIKDVDQDIISAGVKDQNMRLAFAALVKHVNAALAGKPPLSSTRTSTTNLITANGLEMIRFKPADPADGDAGLNVISRYIKASGWERPNIIENYIVPAELVHGLGAAMLGLGDDDRILLRGMLEESELAEQRARCAYQPEQAEIRAAESALLRRLLG